MKSYFSRVIVLMGIALAGLVNIALFFSGDGTYRDIARAEGIDRATFQSSTGPRRYELEALVGLHGATLAYVTARATDLPAEPGTNAPFFIERERGHLADVRAVFGGFLTAGLLGLAASLVVIMNTGRAGAKPVLRLVRDASALAGTGTALVAIVAAVAFDPLFLLFHELFFPQGNFLFDPSSNLITMYPDPYWYGVTLRVGISFVVGVALLAIGAEYGLRRLNSRR